MKYISQAVVRASDAKYAMLAAATVAFLTSPAFAQNKTIGDAASGLQGQMTAVGKLLVIVTAVAGVVMFITGLLRLKKAAENPQTQYGEGAWRIAVGLAMVGLTAFTGMLGQSLGWTPSTSFTASQF